MAATDTTNGTRTFDYLRDAGEQLASVTRKAGNLYLDTYEKAVDQTLELERKFAESTNQEWLHDLIETQSDLTRSYTTAARSFLS